MNYYYPRTLWGITIALNDMFNGFYIYRFDKAGNRVKQIPVPLSDGPIEKMQAAGEVDYPSDKTRYYLTVPKMALTMNGIMYDPSRAISSADERFWLDEALRLDNGDSIYSDYMPAPYNYDFTLAIRSDSMEDLAQILENILPYFNPTRMLRVKEFLFLNVERDLPVRLNSINFDFSDVMESEAMRQVNVNLGLTVEGWMYKPVSTSKMVKVIKSNLFIGDTSGFDEGGNPITNTNLNIRDSSNLINGYDNESNIPNSGYSTSGYNVDINKYWTNLET